MTPVAMGSPVLDGKIAHLTTAVESGAAIEPLIAQLRDRQQERERLIAAIGAAQAVDQIQADRAAIEATVQAQVANWRALLANGAHGRRRGGHPTGDPGTPDDRDQVHAVRGRAGLQGDAL
jgi:hypothetical protein